MTMRSLSEHKEKHIFTGLISLDSILLRTTKDPTLMDDRGGNILVSQKFFLPVAGQCFAFLFCGHWDLKCCTSDGEEKEERFAHQSDEKRIRAKRRSGDEIII